MKTFPPEAKRIDIGDYYCDWSRLREAVGWEPRVHLREGLGRALGLLPEEPCTLPLMPMRYYCAYFDHNYLPRGSGSLRILAPARAGLRALGALPRAGNATSGWPKGTCRASGRSPWRNSSAPTRSCSAPSRTGPSWNITSPARPRCRSSSLPRPPRPTWSLTSTPTFISSAIRSRCSPKWGALHCHYRPSVPACPAAT